MEAGTELKHRALLQTLTDAVFVTVETSVARSVRSRRVGVDRAVRQTPSHPEGRGHAAARS